MGVEDQDLHAGQSMTTEIEARNAEAETISVSDDRQAALLGLHGYVDNLRNKELSGWCRARAVPDPVDCEFLIGEFPYQTTTANLFRSDLLAAGINDGRHGFKFDLGTLDLDAFLQNEVKQMSVRAVGTDIKLEVSSFIPFFTSKSHLRDGLYLANCLTEPERIDCFNTCNKFLFNSMNEKLHFPKPLWVKFVENHSISIVLKHADLAPLEGELAVSVMFDGNAIYSLTFSVIRGQTAGLADPLILFIGGLQGKSYSHERIIKATKINDDVHPRMLLFTAILALCEVWNITNIAAISAHQHISCTPERLKSFEKNYDQLWRDAGGVAQDADRPFYLIPVKRNSFLKHNTQHFHRNLHRRSIRDKIQQEIFQNLSAPRVE